MYHTRVVIPIASQLISLEGYITVMLIQWSTSSVRSKNVVATNPSSSSFLASYLVSKHLHWRTLTRTEYFLFVHHTTSILAKLSTWCFEHSGDISCSLLVNPSHTDESREGRNTCMWIYTL